MSGSGVNRNPEASSKLCRLDGCNVVESMHHLAKCHVTAPLWLNIIAFLNSLPNFSTGTPSNLERLIIFGQFNDNKLAFPLVRATLRHAWQSLYRHLTKLELSGIPFSLDHVFRDTLLTD